VNDSNGPLVILLLCFCNFIAVV